MTEVQSPTPAGTSRPYPSLTEALRAHRIAPENHEFITAIVDAVDISSLIDRGRYIEAIRRDGGAALHIGKTYTNGFAEDEQITVGSSVLRLRPSDARPPYFYTSHPSELLPVPPARATRAKRVPGSAAPAAVTPRAERATKTAEREYGVCDICFMVRTASGTCGCI